MALKFFGNASRMEAVINKISAVIEPALAKAKIVTLEVGGKTIPTSEAPVDVQVAALLAANPVGGGQQEVSNLHVINANQAEQIQNLTNENATLQATVGGLQQDKIALTSRAEAAEATAGKQSAALAQKDIEIKASQDNFTRLHGEQLVFNTELSKACIAVGCLQLTDANGAAIKQTATEEQKLEAANKIPVSEKLKAYQGALNLAASNLGLSIASLPGAPLKFQQTPATGILAQYEAAKAQGAGAGVEFYRKNATAIDEAYRAKQSASK